MKFTEEKIKDIILRKTNQEIRTLISGTSLQPSQLFTEEQLQADTGVKQIRTQAEVDLAAARKELKEAQEETRKLKEPAPDLFLQRNGFQPKPPSDLKVDEEDPFLEANKATKDGELVR
ncbi:MAG: hypothetical protein HOC74_12330 [Gemmatimonadetes bacterium]|jgi:hypothetical protein|nr:hypothetical protein [Gemmatimonadota bacterium]